MDSDPDKPRGDKIERNSNQSHQIVEVLFTRQTSLRFAETIRCLRFGKLLALDENIESSEEGPVYP